MKSLIIRLLHMLGLHHYVRVKDIDPYVEYKCLICDHRASIVYDIIDGDVYEDGFSWEKEKFNRPSGKDL